MNFPVKKVMPRYSIVAILLSLVFVAVFVKAVHIIFFERDIWLAEKERITKSKKKHTAPARRGNILACDGRVLATSLSEYRLWLDFRAWKGEPNPKNKERDQKTRDSLYIKHRDTIALEMHRLFPDIDQKKWLAHMDEGFERKSQHWPLYPQKVTSLKLTGQQRKNRNISYLELAELRKLPLLQRRSSLNAEEIKMRKNPYGEMGYRTIGKFIDTPRFGLELTYDSLLAGTPGEYYREKVLNAWTKRVITEPVDGYDIVTTLDVDIQDICERVLREELDRLSADSGVCIVMEVATGDVKAITSMQRHGGGPFREYSPNAVTTHYEPGSVFKPMSFLVAFDDGKVNIDDEVDICGGVYKFGNRTLYDANYRSGGAVGPRDVKYIIQNSSNVGTARFIDESYAGQAQTFIDGLHRVGVAEDLEVPIDGYWPPLICSPKDKHRYWSRTDLPWMSIGYVTGIPPINTLAFYNGIANNGKMLRPRFVKAVMKDGKVVRELPTVVVREKMAKEEAVRDIRTCLKAVVNGGSGKRAGSTNFQVAGKTGTAQIWIGGHRTSDYSISFVGYYPAENPKYSCIVNIQKAPPAYGWMSGEVFKRVAEYIMARELENKYTEYPDTTRVLTPLASNGDAGATERVRTALNIGEVKPIVASHTEENDTSETLPSLAGFTLREAVEKLDEMGINTKVEGYGVVVKQLPEAGTALEKVRSVTLTMGQPQTNKKKK